jgi:hypothetical protein
MFPTAPCYDLFFTGKDDPRGCIIIGEDTEPIYLVFETTHIPTTRTTVSDSDASITPVK